MEPRWISTKKALEIFSKHNDYESTDEMRRGLYFREFTALNEILNAILLSHHVISMMNVR